MSNPANDAVKINLRKGPPPADAAPVWSISRTEDADAPISALCDKHGQPAL
jgi:hypothetical protein